MELLVGRNAAAETLLDSDLIKSVYTCMCVCVCMCAMVEIQPRGATKPTLHAQPITLQNCAHTNTHRRPPCMAVAQIAALASGCGCRCNSLILLVE